MSVDHLWMVTRNKRIKELEARVAAGEAVRARMATQIALADRLAKAVRSMNVARSADTETVTEWVAGYQSAEAEIREALAAYEAGEPVVQPLTSANISPGGCTCRNCPRDGEPDPHTRCEHCCPYRESDDG